MKRKGGLVYSVLLLEGILGHKAVRMDQVHGGHWTGIWAKRISSVRPSFIPLLFLKVGAMNLITRLNAFFEWGC